VSLLYNFGKDRTEITISNSSSIIVCLFVAAETFVDSAATVWFPPFHFCIHGQPARVCVHELFLSGNVFANSFPRNAYMSQYHASLGSLILQTRYFFFTTSGKLLLVMHSFDVPTQPKQDFSVMRSLRRFLSSLMGEQR
jgi:hypothetical protein